jgi:O-antigen/teichoic acid export membrane protein
MLWSMLAGLPVRLLQILSGILIVPLAYRYLGPERFGLWSAVTALTPLLALADLGIGNGLITAISAATGREDHGRIRGAISTAAAVVGGIAVLLLIVLAGAYAFGDWPRWLNVADTAGAAEARPAGALCLLSAILLLPVGLAAKIRAGLQEAFMNSAWDAAGVVLSLGLFALAIHQGGAMPHLALALSVGPILAALGNGIGLVRRADLRPHWRAIDLEAFRPVARLGLLYFALACAAAAASAADNLIAIHLLGPESAGAIGIAAKIFGAAQAVVVVALLPLWPAVGEALARGDRRWVRRALARSLALAFAVSLVGAGALLAIANPVIGLWLGRGTVLPFGLLAANAVWLVLQCVGNVFAMFLNGAGVIRFQIVVSLAYAAIAVALKLALAPSLGAAGIVWGTVASYGLVLLPLYAGFSRRHLARLAAPI